MSVRALALMALAFVTTSAHAQDSTAVKRGPAQGAPEQGSPGDTGTEDPEGTSSKGAAVPADSEETVAQVAVPSTPAAPEQKDAASFGLQLGSGVALRAGGGLDPEVAEHERVDAAYGLEAWLAPTLLYAIGLRYEHVGQGGEESRTGVGTLKVQRDLDALWLAARVYPWRSESVGAFLRLGLGLSMQSLDANGARPGPAFGPGATFRCTASDGPGLSLDAGGGLDVPMGPRLAFLSTAHVSAYRQSGEFLDACAPGAGSVTNLGADVAVIYRFDIENL